MKKLLALLLIASQAWAGFPPTTTQGANDANKSTTFNVIAGGRNISHSGVTAYLQEPHNSKNYVVNGDFEQKSTKGFSTVHTAFSTANGYFLPTGAASSGVAFDATHGGTASSANFTVGFTTTTSFVLDGQSSGSFGQTTTAPTQGDGVITDAFTVDNADLGKVLTIDLYYKVTSGATNLSMGGKSTDSLAIWVYELGDVSGTPKWIMPAGAYSFVQGSGSGHAVATFQTDSQDKKYQVFIVQANAPSGTAYNLDIDDFRVSAQTAPMGPAMSDWQDYTPMFSAGFGTVTAVAMKYRRAGDSVQITGRFTTGTVAASLATMTLPPGLSLDTTKFTSSAGLRAVGRIERTVVAGTGGADYYATVVADPANPTVLYFTTQNNSNNGGSELNGSAIFASSEVQWVESTITVPIAGWSSNTVQSSDTDTRVVAATAILSADQTGVGPNNSYVKVAFNGVDSLNGDSHAAFDTVNHRYVVPVTGWYHFDGNIYIKGTNSLNNLYAAVLYKNGVDVNRWGAIYNPTATAVVLPRTAGVIYLSAGDYLELYLYGSGNNSASTLTLAGLLTYFSINRLSGPAVVSATESVSLRYHGAGQSISASTNTTITAWTKDWDDHNAFSSGVFTSPVPGTYAYDYYCDSSGNNSGGTYQVIMNKNGSSYSVGYTYTSVNTVPYSAQTNGLAHLNQGDTLSTLAFQNSASSITVCTGNGHVEIWRVGH